MISRFHESEIYMHIFTINAANNINAKALALIIVQYVPSSGQNTQPN